ncbi:hypothetical protein J6590_076282 [Homalodisca vitripennis]|nr:hypothetical protein J6590_076282 [Homalodisca vitripennis]
MKNALVKNIFYLEECMFGLSMNDVRRLACQLAEQNDLAHNFNKNEEVGGKNSHHNPYCTSNYNPNRTGSHHTSSNHNPNRISRHYNSNRSRCHYKSSHHNPNCTSCHLNQTVPETTIQAATKTQTVPEASTAIENSIMKLSPIPRGTENSRQGAQKAVILSISPYKADLVMAKDRKAEREEKAEKRKTKKRVLNVEKMPNPCKGRKDS